MKFKVQGKTEKYVKLMKDGNGIEFLGIYKFLFYTKRYEIDQFNFTANRFLVEYEVQTEVLRIKSENNISVASLQFVFRRRMEYHVTNTFLQV